MIILSDSLEIPDSKNWKILTKQNDVVRIHIKNPMEEHQISSDESQLLHVATKKHGYTFDVLNFKSKKYTSLFFERKEKLLQTHRNSGSDYFEIITE